MTTCCHAILFFIFFLDIENKATIACYCRLLCSNNTIEGDNDTLSLFFSFLIKKVTIVNCYCFLHLNTTREEGDGNKLPLLFSLQQHFKRRQRQIAIIFLFLITPPQKKTMAHCRHILLFKHKEDKTHKKTTKPREGREFTFKLPLLPFYFKCFLMASSSFQTKEKKKKTKKKRP